MKQLLVILSLLASYSLFSQDWIAKVNGKPIDVSEFEISEKYALENLPVQEVLDDYIGFELLAEYAIQNGAEEQKEFLVNYSKDIQALKDTLYYPSEIIQGDIDKYYERLQTQIKAQIIAIKDKDVARKVYQDISNNSISFDEALKKYGEIKELATPRYYSPLMLAKEIEDNMYSMMPGDISAPIQAGNSNYIIRVIELKPFYGSYNPYHIVFMSKDSEQNGLFTLEAEKVTTQAEVHSLQEKWKNNPKVESITMDSHTPIPDKVLEEMYAFFNTHPDKALYNKVLNFDEAVHAFYFFRQINLKNKKTASYLIQKRAKGTYLEESWNEKIHEKIKNSPYFEEDENNKKLLIQSLQNENYASEYDSLLLYRIKDSVYTVGQIRKEILAKTQNGMEMSKLVDNYLDTKQYFELNAFYDSFYFYQMPEVKSLIAVSKRKHLLDYAINRLNNTSAANDEDGMRRYLKEHQEDFMWKDFGEGAIYYCTDEYAVENVVEMIKQGKTPQEIANHFSNDIDKTGVVKVFTRIGKIPQNSKEFPPRAVLVPGVQIEPYNNKIAVIDFKSVGKSLPMTLEDAKPRIIDIYQNYKLHQLMQKVKKEATIEKNTQAIRYLEKKYGQIK